jgi:hypothetical protein
MARNLAIDFDENRTRAKTVVPQADDPSWILILVAHN